MVFPLKTFWKTNFTKRRCKEHERTAGGSMPCPEGIAKILFELFRRIFL